jgi:hypothetical protein
VRVLLTAAAAAVVISGCATARADSGGGLAKSTVSSHRVQPQPPAGSCHYRGHGVDSLPDPRCTPGAIDPTVNQADIHRTICVTGYTERIRPPEDITEPEKRASLRSYGDHRPLHDFEYDHLVALELGGARNDPRNLWPDPGPIPNLKDKLAGRLRARVCDGEMKLATAQLLIARDWVSAFRRYG